MSLRALGPLALFLLCVGAGCSKADVSMQNDLRGVPGVGKSGQNDDGLKPRTPAGPLTPVVGKSGQNDDGLKPGPAQPLPVPQTINRVGNADDSVKTAPKTPPRP